MIGYLVLLVAISGLASGAPQNWPYRDSLMPYRYGYPNQQAQYKYLPQIEDDEDVGPYFQPQPKGRQEFVVGSDGDRVIPTLPPPSVVETGSVAPVVEQNRIPTTAVPPPTKAPTPPPPKPQGAAPNKPVQPPAFPPARPPPPPKREKEVEEDEDEDEDDDESEEGDDDADDQPDDGDDDDNDDEEEEDDRRRQEPISKEEPEKETEVVKVVEKKDKKKEKVQSNKPEKVEKKQQQQQSSQNEPPAPVVVPAPKPNDNHKSVVKSQQSVKTKVPTTSAVDDNEDKPVVDSNEVVKPNGEADDESSEEQGLDDGVEALVPGYVTEQGEILVPVDTVTGNQPISIVPDPYSPPTRGVPLRQHQQRPTYRTPYEYYYPEVYPGLGRQVPQKLEDSDEVQDDDNSSAPEMDDSTETSAAESDEQTTNSKPGRNEFLTAFPPSRSPEFYAVIKSRFPASSSEEQYESMPQGYQNFQGYPGQVPFRPVQFRRRPQPQSQGQQVAVAVSLSNSNEAQSQQQFVRRPSYPSPMPYPVYSGANRFPGPYSAPYLRNSYGYYKVPVYRPQHPPSPYALQQSQRRPVPPVNPFYARPPQGFRPRPVYKKPPVNYNQYNYNYGGFGASSGQFTPVLIRKNPHTGGFGGPLKKPVSYSKRPVNKPVRKPTPVTYQDDEPYPFVQPMNPNYYPSYPYDYQDDGVSGSDENNSSQQFDSSSVETPKIIQGGTTRTTGNRGTTTTKNRRAAKMTKSKFDKKEKKESMKQKKVSDPDPLNILKKISTKRS